MIRMVFSELLEMTPDKLDRMSEKLAPLPVKIILENSGRAKMIIDTDQLAGNLAYALGARNYTFCSGCNTLHFDTAENCKDVFVCLCGKTLNNKR